MKIAGLQKFSMIDYPDKLCAIIFTQGCNFRCPYCHNPELVKPTLFQKTIPQAEVLQFLKTRKEKLDAVTITGGEPTLHKDLLLLISQIKEMGFLVKLDTNGTNPTMLKLLIDHRLVDYIAMDIKAPIMKYQKVTCSTIDVLPIIKSIDLIKKSRVNYEFRTTVVKELLSDKDLEEIVLWLGKVKKYYLQKFITSKTLDSRFMQFHSHADEQLEAVSQLHNYVFVR